jgi:hypothetical protein
VGEVGYDPISRFFRSNLRLYLLQNETTMKPILIALAIIGWIYFACELMGIAKRARGPDQKQDLTECCEMKGCSNCNE